MSTASNPYRGFRFPAEIISEAVWLYHCFSLSLREVELILAARGIEVSYETIREWELRFGRDYANTLKRRQPKPGDKWFLDEVFIGVGSLIAGTGGKPSKEGSSATALMRCSAGSVVLSEVGTGPPHHGV